MPIKEIIDKKTGEKYYDAYVSITSKQHPHIRKQRRKTKIKTKSLAIRLEKELYHKAFYEVQIEENKGYSLSLIHI